MHVFVAGYWSVEVEILNVNCREVCIERGDNTVEQEFYRKKINSWRAAVARVIDSVATNGEPSPIRVILFGSVVDNNTSVGDISPAICWYFGFVDEKNCVGSRHLSWDTLRQSAKLFGVRLPIQFAILWVLHEGAIFHKLPSVFIEDGVEHLEGKFSTGEALGGQFKLVHFGTRKHRLLGNRAEIGRPASGVIGRARWRFGGFVYLWQKLWWLRGFGCDSG